MTGAALFARCLTAAGIDTVYALPGEETAHLMDALAAVEIDIVICRHEQGAAFMAAAHGRMTRRPAACLATLGPGATNLLTGVADATLDGVPMLVITGQGGRARIGAGRHSHQILPLDRVFAPVTKFSHTVHLGEEIPDRVARAVQIARAELPGAAHLCLPEDVAAGTVDVTPSTPPEDLPPFPNPNAIADVAEALGRATRPVALVGAGVHRADATAAIGRLLEATGIAVITTFMGKGAVDPTLPVYLGSLGMPVEDHADRAIASADLVLLIGVDPVEYPLARLAPDAPMVSFAATPLPHDTAPRLAAQVTGDVAQALVDLRAALAGTSFARPPRLAAARQALDRERAEVTPPGASQSARALAVTVDRALPPDAILFSGVGTHKLALARNLHPPLGVTTVVPNGLAGMGLALPGAIAAARLFPDRPVVAVCGDGDVLMNVQEMETATRLDVDLTVMVWIDGGYGLIEDKQEKTTGDRPDLSFAGVDWPNLAHAFGWTHNACDTAAAAEGRLADAMSAGGRTLLTVPVRYTGDLA